MKIKRFVVNPFGENTYLIWNEDSCEAAIIDPGMSNDSETGRVDEAIKSNGLKVKYLLFTHLHADHALGAHHIINKYEVKPMCSEAENMLGKIIPQQAVHFGLRGTYQPVFCESTLKDGDVLRLGTEEIKVLSTPGHSPGGLTYYLPNGNILFSGDTLFESSVGRTDLPGGDERMLISSIKTKILTLPADTVVYPGHGGATTVGMEAENNYFLR